MGYLHDALYPVERSRQAGAVLVAGSDAPVDSRDPRPFENMAAGIVQAAGSGDDFRASQRTSLAEMLAAYTINGARAVRQGDITGSIEAGKSADFIVLDGTCSPWSRPAPGTDRRYPGRADGLHGGDRLSQTLNDTAPQGARFLWLILIAHRRAPPPPDPVAGPG
jgi:cytosine/adenosine deaminase-related metal-dependent hydrolase